MREIEMNASWMNEARLEAMLLAILMDIKTSKAKPDLDALSLTLMEVGTTYCTSDHPHSVDVGTELRVISRFLAAD
jgi:hypothetical protein